MPQEEVNKKHLKIVVLVSLGLYFLFIGKLLFVQHGSIDRHTLYQERMMDLTPFSGTWFNLKLAAENPGRFAGRALVLTGGNFLLLTPWGLAAPFLFPVFRQIRRLAFSGFLLSLSIETVQYLFRLGVFEFDDLLLNTLGVLAGYYGYQQIRSRALPFFGQGKQQASARHAKLK